MALFHAVVHTVGAKYYDTTQVAAWSPQGAPNKEKRLIEVVEAQQKVHRGVTFLNYKMRKKLSS